MYQPNTIDPDQAAKSCHNSFISACWEILHAFFQKYIHLVSMSLDSDHNQHFAGPDLGPKGLQNLSADISNGKF